MSTKVPNVSNATAAKPMEFRQRRPRQIANPVVSNKPDVCVEFSTSKLGIRVRGGDDKMGLYVAAVTNEAPSNTRDKIPEGAQIISVNEHNLEGTPFDKAVEHFAQLTLPITVRFRPPLHPPKKTPAYSSGHHHDHDHDHHHHNDDDDDQEGTCYIACYLILFVLLFMFLVSMSLNGWPGIPTSIPSMPRLFPSRTRGDRRRRGKRNKGGIFSDSTSLKDQMRQKKNMKTGNNRRILDDMIDMNNPLNILNNMDMNLNDIDVDQLLQEQKK
eukprot:266324_1